MDSQCQMFLIQDGIWGENVFSQHYFFLNQKYLSQPSSFPALWISTSLFKSKGQTRFWIQVQSKFYSNLSKYFPWVFKLLRYHSFLHTWDTSRPRKTCSKRKTKSAVGARKTRVSKPTQEFHRGASDLGFPLDPSQDSHEDWFGFTFVQSYFSHCRYWDSPFDACCGSQISSSEWKCMHQLKQSPGVDICRLACRGKFCRRWRCSDWAGLRVFQWVPVPISFTHLVGWC